MSKSVCLRVGELMLVSERVECESKFGQICLFASEARRAAAVWLIFETRPDKITDKSYN